MSQFVDFFDQQEQRNEVLLRDAKYLGKSVESKVLPFSIDIDAEAELSNDKLCVLSALDKQAASIAVSTMSSGTGSGAKSRTLRRRRSSSRQARARRRDSCSSRRSKLKGMNGKGMTGFLGYSGRPCYTTSISTPS